MRKNNPALTTIVTVAAIAVVVAVSIILKSAGDIEYTFEDASFSVHTSMWKDLSVNYEDINSAELREDIVIGSRENGYGSKKLNMGRFSNSEFGNYTLYAYTSCNSLVLLHMKDGSVIVLGGEDRETSGSVYNSILNRIS